MRDRINLYSQNIKRLLTNEAASANMHVADQIVELGVGAILVGGFELYGIQMIINATRLTGVVQTMFTTVLVILIMVADIYVFHGAARSASKGADIIRGVRSPKDRDDRACLLGLSSSTFQYFVLKILLCT